MPPRTRPISTAEGIGVQLGYDGPALTSGRMDVRVLAGAMASVAQLVDDATRIVYGTDSGVRVEISGDFRRGSFTYQIVATALAGLSPDQVKATLTWLGLLSAPTGITVIGVLKWLRGRRITAVRRDGDSATITTGDQSTVVNVQIAQLVMNQTIRNDFEGLTQPLEQSGIRTLKVGEVEGPPASEITQAERPFFVAPPPKSEALHEQESEAILTLVSPVFKIGNKWQFAYPGEPAFYAQITDKGFLERLQRHEVTFGFGDLVRVRLKTTITRIEGGPAATSREIVEVLEIVPPPALQEELFG